MIPINFPPILNPLRTEQITTALDSSTTFRRKRPLEITLCALGMINTKYPKEKRLHVFTDTHVI